MSTLHKFKAYFGMVPLDDFEDDYLDDTDAPVASRSSRGGYGKSMDDHDYADRDYAEPAFVGGRRDEDDDYERPEPRHSARVAPLSSRSGGGSRSGGAMRTSTRGALAMDTRMDPHSELRRSEPRHAEPRVSDRRQAALDDGGPMSTITTLRPRDYSEARTIGERFRDGTPVIMDLVEMSNADAKRLVDFAAGLAFALRGSFDKVATKVFLLSPADVDVSAEERRRIAETGFYNQQ
ncbi:cell division protein SepF [Rhodococcus sp. BP-349]|jgi:cell division inhibitor SepF|uniref:Cell division protein SepF n=1 Tax=Rhodococcoides corynebacterioides TaxID=53972 RepID=A0ABS2KT36_9NOCA|nr:MULTISPECIES: cell division protein SepF [Rhodococcus]MBM7415120.1 cell division inhibitor SepF [Rhodococcus corynebacterioides]MBP1117582.1 cell division inhibitor SepF [Rhodococcus sp. PvP016]MBY6540752.1 cell division protein SepF [Rhodococcus sp. BP-363]MBY6545222.1 cell division protein SepF [Rhodococcus sp. BP-369]MBY6564452.1 cell division protein SepF [Rhodococcus sp. BP-370]